MEIKYIPQESVDKIKWNSCVHYASNGNVYGYKWYLDCVAKEWDALVEGDYESVFPLIWKDRWLKKKMLYQPPLIGQAGIYSVNILSNRRISSFLKAIPSTFGDVDVTLNDQNKPPEGLGFVIRENKRYQLILNRPYEAIAEKYSAALQNDLENARKNQLTLTTSLKPERVAEFYKEHHPDGASAKKAKFHAIQRVLYNVLHRGWGNASGVMDRNGTLLAVNFFIYTHGKALSYLPVVSPPGRQRGALSFLFDIFIRSNTDRPLILDFNSGDEFYEHFGDIMDATSYGIQKKGLLF